MKILTAAQIRAWDEFTILHEPVSSLQLMERAARQCVQWLVDKGYRQRHVSIFCGKGNNGGDGLAIARMLWEMGTVVTVYIPEFGHKGTVDFQDNLARLHALPVNIIFIQSESHFHHLPSNELVIDALFGSGLNRPPEGLNAAIISFINDSGCEVISIDIPSGLSSEGSSLNHCAISARHTLSFQCMKPAFFLAENAARLGKIYVLDIGLHPDFEPGIDQRFNLLLQNYIEEIYRPRPDFAHKGDFGHALLVAGNTGKMGAAILSARGCLRGGAGLLTCLVPDQGLSIIQTAVPEAMAITRPDHAASLRKIRAIGMGPGMGTEENSLALLKFALGMQTSPLVLDADALNLLALHQELLHQIPAQSIITPHPAEFDRLFGPSENDWARLEKAIQMAVELNVFIVLKGHYTLITSPEGKNHFNTTGNPGMATGGSGDVLTGLLTSLLAQGYGPHHACLIGVYLHGMAGDLAAATVSEEALVAGDIVDFLGAAYQTIGRNRKNPEANFM